MIETTTIERTTTWRTVAQTGAWAFVVWAVVLQVGSLFFDPFMTLVAVLFAVGARALRTGKRSRVIAFTVLACLVMAANLAFGSTDLMHPESAGSFVPSLFATLALALALVGGLGVARSWATERAGLTRTGAIGLFTAGLATALLITSMTPSDVSQPGDVHLAVEGFAFEPGTVGVDLDDGGLWIDNRDMAHHAFAVADLGIDLQLPAGKARRIDLGEASAGTYNFVCTIPGHESMTGQLVVMD